MKRTPVKKVKRTRKTQPIRIVEGCPICFSSRIEESEDDWRFMVCDSCGEEFHKFDSTWLA